MSLRSFFLASTLVVLPTTALFAQDVVQQPAVENSKYHFEGIINSGSVYVRSGPGEGYYATQRLDKGASITVVGIKFDWLKITPPEGSFCYVGSVFVDRSGNGSVGRINRNDVNVRAGSQLYAMKTTVQARLNVGDEVQIIGTEDEYLKIKPPAGAYLYINKQFVDMGKPLPDAGDAGATPVSTGTATPAANDNTGPVATSNPPADSGNPAAGNVNGGAPSIDGGPAVANANQGGNPASSTANTNSAAVASKTSSTQPSQVAMAAAATQPSAEDQFGKFESQFVAMSKQPLTDQKIDDLSAEYKTIANADGLSDTLKQVVQLRLATLSARADSQQKMIAMQKMEKEASEKQMVMAAEQQELAERLKATDVQIYAAVGQLEPSSLQVGGGTLYRLVDPGTGRTVIYLRTNDTKVTSLLGSFIGVKGDTETDPQLSLRIISPTDVAQVDPSKVNGSVAAEIIPPSMLARQASASSSGN